MVDVELIRSVGMTLAVIMSVPMVLTLVRAIRFFSNIERTAQDTADQLNGWTAKLDKILEDHSLMLSNHDKELAVLKDRANWDGLDERRVADRRKHDHTD